jgi:hypothetical protein
MCRWSAHLRANDANGLLVCGRGGMGMASPRESIRFEERMPGSDDSETDAHRMAYGKKIGP